MVFLRKLKRISPSTSQHYNNCPVPTFLILFKNILAPPPFQIEGDYAFYMRDYKGETIKLLSFYMTDFFTELKHHNIKLKNNVKYDTPNIPSDLHICDPNLL